MTILITGGAGFIGSNVANAFAEEGHKVIIVDNLSRPNVEKNIDWLQKKFNNVFFIKNDIRTPYPLHNPDVIFHFASQVAVTTSLEDPVEDLEINIVGTINLLEEVRKMENKPLIVFASTNKVYGDISVDKPVSEDQPLSFCSPYGCSKGAAEQYMLDYYRTYGVQSVVLRMSCIYGERQFGTEEQGWLAHFTKAQINNEPVTIYGDGSQVRDLLYISDYVSLMKSLVKNKDKVVGKAFNVGGGIENAISINTAIEKIGNRKISYDKWRIADQHYYVSDISKITEFTGWKPTISVDEGLERLKEWVKEI